MGVLNEKRFKGLKIYIYKHNFILDYKNDYL